MFILFLGRIGLLSGHLLEIATENSSIATLCIDFKIQCRFKSLLHQDLSEQEFYGDFIQIQKYYG